MLKLLIILAVALAMPVSQLQTQMVVTSCCCPDPAHCQCPDHGRSAPGQPSMRACHRTQQIVDAPVGPSFTAPVAVAIAAPDRVLVSTVFVLATPHAPPSPARPAAPS